MKITKIITALAVPVFAVSVFAADSKPAAKPAAKPAPKQDAKPAAKPAPKQDAKAKPAATKSNAEVLAFLPNVVAEYNGKKLYRIDVIREVSQMVPPGLLAQLPKDKLNAIIHNIINTIIDRDLLLNAIKKQGYTPSAKLAKEEMMRMYKALPKDQAAKVDAQLKMQGKTFAGYAEEAAAQPMAQQSFTFQKWMREKFEPGIKVTDKEAEKFYKENPKEFEKPETVEASHILIRVQPPAGKEKDPKAVKAADAAAKAKITAILAQIRKGADFGKLAEKESSCPSGKKKGFLGEFNRGMMVPEFEKAAFALKPGQVSGIVKTQFGYHLIKVSKKTAKSTVPFVQAKPGIVSFLKAKKSEAAFKALIEKERKTAKVSISKF